MRRFGLFSILLLTSASSAFLLVSNVQAETEIYVDKLGRRVEMNVPVNRVAFFETYELIAHLDIWDRIVAISRHAYANDLIRAVKPDIEEIPSAGTGADVNIEALLRFKPDLVVTWTWKPATVKFMEEKGLKVIAIYLQALSELYDVMRLQGRLFEKEEQVERSIMLMEKILNLIRERVFDLPEDRIKSVLWLGGRPDHVAGGIGIPQNIFSILKGINVAQSMQQENAEVSLEQIIAWNPQIIFIWGGARYDAKEILESPHWRNVRAVKQGCVYKAPHWSRWSPRLAPVALWMAMRTYPERFTDINLENTVEDFFQKLYGISYRKTNSINN
jgi:iron complex transport system substrate-binding protein